MRLGRRRRALAAALLTLATAMAAPIAGAGAQAAGRSYPPVTLPGTELRTLRAASNGVPYRLYVALPPGYGAAGKRFPVVYMLDADYSFAIARNIAEHLTVRGDLPAVVLVAIAYQPGGQEAYRANRTRDYTPTHSDSGGYGPDYQKLSGGAPAFLRFIRDELIPFVDSSYSVSSDRALVGHSYGGLFVLWTMLEEPTLFRRVIAVSPSLWYDRGVLLRLEERRSAELRAMPVRLYAGVGGRENPRMASDLQRFTGQLRRHAYVGLEMDWRVLDTETHNSLFPIVLTEGLRWIYADLGAR